MALRGVLKKLGAVLVGFKGRPKKTKKMSYGPLC